MYLSNLLTNCLSRMALAKRLLKFSLVGLGALGTIYALPLSQTWAYPEGSPAARAGAPGEQTCATSNCHGSFALNSGAGAVTLNGLPTGGYVLGQEYTLSAVVSQPQRATFGFQLTALDEQGRSAGTLSLSENTRTQLRTATISGNLRQYIGQARGGTSANGTNQSSWTLRWKAPTQSAGRVTFYLAGLAADNDGNDSGDHTYTKSFPLETAATGPAAVATVSAASFASGALASEVMAALFGTNLATSTVLADTQPLPVALGGVKVQIRDAANITRDAGLFFVSAIQINLLLPAGLANGPATLSVVRGIDIVGQGAINIENSAPGLFAANANGQGVPAAVALRIKADNTQNYEPVAQRNIANTAFEPVPLELGPTGETIFLILYGTGFRNHSGLSNVTCTIGGQTAQVTFAGPQGGLAGLDQANVRIPRELIGRGTMNLLFAVDGKSANGVTINVK
jgi:uncharacterized protein (TIGR03437 family)